MRINWNDIMQKFPKASIIDVIVIKHLHYGILVSLNNENVDGLIPITELNSIPTSIKSFHKNAPILKVIIIDYTYDNRYLVL